VTGLKAQASSPKPEGNPPRVLLVIRDDRDRLAVAGAVRGAGHRVSAVDQATAALAEFAEHPPGVVIVDLVLGGDAQRVIRAASTQPKPVAAIAIADRRHPEASAEALRLGVVDVVSRPIASGDIAAALKNAAELREIQAHPGPPEPDVSVADGMLLSVGLRKVWESVRHLSKSRANVLIVGERGSGRERLALAIHAQGGHPQPYVAIDCSYVAAPGVSADDIARFEHELSAAIAQPRPIFLRNVSDLPLAVQGTLERLSADRERAGGDSLPRVLASAEPPIGEAVERKLFRRDLFERLAVVRLDLPPLRQRPQDVALLVSLFLKDACRRHDLGAKIFSPSARALLAALPWRGNASELRLLAERLALIVSRGVIQQEDVLAEVRFDGAETRGHAEGTLREARGRFERDYITSVLQRHRGRMGAAAKELGIERTNLYRKIKQLKIRT